MHYEGPGDYPGADGKGYGYSVRVGRRTERGAEEVTPAVAAQA